MGLRVKIVFCFILFCVIFGLRFLCANCQYLDGIDEQNDENQQNSQIWHVTTVPSSYNYAASTESYLKDFQDIQTWSSDENQPLRRRRPGLRKRKRRPQQHQQQGYTTEYISPDSQKHWRGHVHDDSINFQNENQDIVINNKDFISTDAPSYSSHYPPPLLPSPTPKINWRTHSSYPPKYPERIREPLAALEKEQKLYELRDKQRKELESETSVTVRDKSYRKPYSQAKLEVMSTVTQSSNNAASDLKNILKTSGGLSLSEILQQRNLSLDDLLKGKQNALMALQMSTSSPDALENDEYKYKKPNRRVPWSYSSSSTVAPKHQQNIGVSATIQSEDNFELNSNQSLTKNKYLPKRPISSFKNDNTGKNQHQNDEAFENTPNAVELATIVTLRDNPPLRNFQSKPVKNIVFPSIPKSKIFKSPTTTAQTKLTSSHETKEIEKEVTYVVDDLEQSSTTTTTKTSTSNRPTRNYSRNYYHSLGSKIPKLNVHSTVPSLYSSSSTIAESSSKEQPEDIKSENLPSEQKSSIENKNSQESVEEILKKTRPDINYVHQFSSFEEIDSKEMTKLEDLFDSSISFKGKESKHQIITPRIDRFLSSTQPKQLISTEKFDVTETNPSLFIDFESYQSDDDHTDILELIEDRRSGGRLFKILAQRNMTLEQLIEHRRRGSSQLHLAEIVYNKTSIKNSKPEIKPSSLTKSDIFGGKMDIVTAFENFPQFNLVDLKSIKPDEIKTDSQGSSYFTSIIDIEPTDEIYKEGRSMKIFDDTEAKTQTRQQQRSISKTETSLNQKNSRIIPSWKTFSISSFTSQEQQHNKDKIIEHSNTANNNNNNRISSSHLSSLSNKDNLMDDDVIKIEDEVAKAHDLLELELSGHGFKKNEIPIENDITQMTPGIRSAIIASTGIVIISLTIFLIIFAICRWKHRRKNKLAYTDTYNAIKRRLPILISGQSSNFSNNSISTITCSGLKNNKLNTMDPNSSDVQEYLYDAMRKQF